MPAIPPLAVLATPYYDSLARAVAVQALGQGRYSLAMGVPLAAQLDETLANLDSLLATARARRAALAAHFGPDSRLKVYVRDADALPQVAALLESRLPAQVPRIVLHGQVCRRELAVEIDGVPFLVFCCWKDL